MPVQHGITRCQRQFTHCQREFTRGHFQCTDRGRGHMHHAFQCTRPLAQPTPCRNEDTPCRHGRTTCNRRLPRCLSQHTSHHSRRTSQSPEPTPSRNGVTHNHGRITRGAHAGTRLRSDVTFRATGHTV